MHTKIDEELRQYKLYKIQETESKLRRFKKVYKKIKEHVFIKLSKNISSNIIKFSVYIIGISFLLIGLVSFFPYEILTFLESNGNLFSSEEKEAFTNLINISKYFFLSLSILFSFVGYLLKLNNQKRSYIYDLSILLEEVMDYMENSVTEDKKKYEYFVDSIAEKDKIIRKAQNQ